MKQSTKSLSLIESDPGIPISKGESLIMSLAEAAVILGIQRTTAWSLYKRGEFPAPVLKIGSNLRVVRAHLQLFLETGDRVRPGTRVDSSQKIGLIA
jgi:predicted DNA-binding transcriptional regulator AlpA